MIAVGDHVTVTIYLELPTKEEKKEKTGKERVQAFKGVVISKHLSGARIESTITVRKMFQGGATEKVFLLNSPWIKNIEISSRSSVKRAKLYYLRDRAGKDARLKRRIKL